jgi:16S rRNA (guanine1207-N2)-methyltransferase
VHDARDAQVAYDRAELDGVAFSWRAGCRGHPQAPAGWRELVRAAARLEGDVLDASACLGVAGRAAARPGARVRVTVLEPSAIALAALRHDLEAAPPDAAVPRVEAGLPWDADRASFDHVLSAPPAERGSARVRAELDAAARALRPGGTLWLLLEKDRGAKRYERDAAARFAGGEVVARHKGFRLSRWRAPRPAEAPAGGADEARADGPWIRFDAPGGDAWALAGVHAAGKLDPGSALLLSELAAHGTVAEGATVLDLGCGWGPLARHAAAGGARVTAVDDDLAAVRATRRNVPTATVLHGDLDQALPVEARYARVLVNPPFHVGTGVRLDVGRRFLAAARRRVAAGGEIWLVANDALPYEAAFPAGDEVAEVARERGFKVLRVRPRSAR